MTDNHTELCEKLREVSSYRIPIPAQGILVKAADLIESQAVRIQQQAARIAELEKERDALKADAETYRALKAGAHPSYNAIVSINGHSLSLERKELVTVHFVSWAALESALQAEKEGRDER